MSTLIYISHPQVEIDPAVPVPEWGISELGRMRAERAARSFALKEVKSIYASTERKAIETASIFAKTLGLPFNVREGLHENDRSATGFVPPDEFEKLADAFFAKPLESILGWETAAAAQVRIIQNVTSLLVEAPDGDIIIAGHGGVGTLLYCQFSGHPIAREFDQKSGGGCFFAVDRRTQTATQGWLPIEEISSCRQRHPT